MALATAIYACYVIFSGLKTPERVVSKKHYPPNECIPLAFRGRSTSIFPPLRLDFGHAEYHRTFVPNQSERTELEVRNTGETIKHQISFIFGLSTGKVFPSQSSNVTKCDQGIKRRSKAGRQQSTNESKLETGKAIDQSEAVHGGHIYGLHFILEFLNAVGDVIYANLRQVQRDEPNKRMQTCEGRGVSAGTQRS